MTATSPSAGPRTAAAPATISAPGWRQRFGWTIGVWLLLGALVLWYTTLIPNFGSFQVASLAKNSLPLAYLAMAQAIIVIGGGIDLSVGAMMVLTSCIAAQTMQGRSLTVSLILGAGIVLLAAVLDGLVGWFIHRSRIPDIVATLAMSFVLSGVALLVLSSPGGGTAPGFRYLFTGSATGTGTNYWPPIIMMAIPTILLVLLRRTRTGLTIYATGSDRNAAFLAGVDIRRAKIASYAFGGAMAGMAGLATIAITGTGDPRASLGGNATLNSVAAIVLGGVALTGGVGSVVGVVAAAVVLVFLIPILSSVGVDPNSAQVIQGSLIALVMMVAGLIELRRRRA
jgi:ribose transport system permease protein